MTVRHRQRGSWLMIAAVAAVMLDILATIYLAIGFVRPRFQTSDGESDPVRAARHRRVRLVALFVLVTAPFVAAAIVKHWPLPPISDWIR